MKNRIREVRKTNGLNQSEFAEKIGLTQNYISLVESGQREASDRTIRDICREFHVNEEWLRSGTGDMYITPEDDDVAALSQMLECSSDQVSQSLIAFWKAYKSLDDISQQIIRDQIDDLAKKLVKKSDI